MANFALITAASTILLLALIFSKTRIWLARSRIIKENQCKPAPHYPHKIPILGLDYMLRLKDAFYSNTIFDMWKEEMKRFGPTYQVSFFGQEAIFSQERANIHSVLAADFESWGVGPLRYEHMKPFVGDTLFTVDGPFWKHARDLTRPALSRAEFGDLSRLDFHVTNLLAAIDAAGSITNFSNLSTRFLQDIMSEYFLGESGDALVPSARGQKSDEQTQLFHDIDYCMSALVERTAFGGLIKYIPANKTFLKACLNVQGYIDKHIDRILAETDLPESEKGTTKHHINFLEEMVKESSDRKVIRSNAMLMYLAGTDTTQVTFANIIFVLSRYPEVAAKLREEIEAHVPLGEKPTVPMLQKLTYFRAILDETQRLYPVTPINVRTALKDTMLPTGGGPDGKSKIFVKKGTTFIPFYLGLHHNPEVWGDDVMEFKPERWLGPSKTALQQNSFAFGAGGRVCPGQQLAVTNITYTVTRLIQHYTIESRDDRPYVPQLKISTANVYPCLVEFVKT